MWANLNVFRKSVRVPIPDAWKQVICEERNKIKAAGFHHLPHGGQAWQDRLFEAIALSKGAQFSRSRVHRLSDKALRINKKNKECRRI